MKTYKSSTVRNLLQLSNNIALKFLLLPEGKAEKKLSNDFMHLHRNWLLKIKKFRFKILFIFSLFFVF